MAKDDNDLPNLHVHLVKNLTTALHGGVPGTASRRDNAAPLMEDPFATFREWASEADAAAYDESRPE